MAFVWNLVSETLVDRFGRMEFALKGCVQSWDRSTVHCTAVHCTAIHCSELHRSRLQCSTVQCIAVGPSCTSTPSCHPHSMQIPKILQTVQSVLGKGVHWSMISNKPWWSLLIFVINIKGWCLLLEHTQPWPYGNAFYVWSSIQLETELYHNKEVPVFTEVTPVSKRDQSCFKQEVVPFRNGSTSLSNREWFRFETGVLPFQTWATTVS